MTKIFLVDDHPFIRQMVRSQLEREPDLSVCGEASTAAEALAAIKEDLPDLMLIDVSLPGMSGIELARLLHEKYPHLHLAILSGHGEKTHVDQALEAGGRGYVLKGNAAELPGAIRQVLRGEQYLSPSLAS